MKRLILLATMMVAVLASCEKHEIQNEVINEIGFTQKVGKQTKAIAQNETYADANAISTYFQSQPFGVYAYSHQTVDGTERPQTRVMKNVEISYASNAWKSANDTTYYWPNDSRTTLNFYAYSPFIKTQTTQGYTQKATENHQIITLAQNGVLKHSEANGLEITGYVHSNMYVDFMVADKVEGRNYSNTGGTVPLTFRHKMSQIVFTVQLDKEYSGITFNLEKLQLNNIFNQGKVGKKVVTQNTTETTLLNEMQVADGSTTANYVIYPAAAKSTENGAPIDAAQNATDNWVITQTASTESNILPVTMIPQAISGQTMTIIYTITGKGVATETVEKNINLPATINWEANKKITYALTIGMNEIKFAPRIADWSDETYDHDPQTSGNQPLPLQ